MQTLPRKAVADHQTELNRSTRGQWALFATHRREIEKLLVAALPNRRVKLCVLGAGNCNDLDLRWAVKVFAEVHLIDIDADALQRAVRRQRVGDNDAIHPHGGVDLTGIAPVVDRWTSCSSADAAACARLALDARLKLDVLPAFDVVLSPCVMTQLVNPIRDAIGSGNPGFAQIRAAVRRRHIRLMAELLAPGGSGILVCDLASSDTISTLPRVPPEQVPDLMRTLLNDGKCFRGMEPASISADFAIEPLGRLVTNLQWPSAWLWHLGLRRSYLVYAACFNRHHILQGSHVVALNCANSVLL